MIPKKLHFIFGLSPDFGGKPFSFVHWAAIRSAQIANPGYATSFWCNHEPDNRYFDAIRPFVTIKYIEPPDTVFNRPIPHVAHKCDWLRLQILKEHGGIYLDVDTITLKPYEPVIESPCTMAVETCNGATVGLCNAFIAAEPNASFIVDWIEKFREFRSMGREQHWNESAVQWPHQLWRKGGECRTLLPSSFMLPDWTHEGIRKMFVERHEFPRAIGHHLWESISWPYLQQYTPESYQDQACTYADLLDRYLGTEIKRAFGV